MLSQRAYRAQFILLALGTTAVFTLGAQRWLQTGLQAFAQPLLADYAQRLAAEISTPADPQTALALAQRLPIAIAIEGPDRLFQTHPDRFGEKFARHAGHHDSHNSPWRWTVNQADGQRIHFVLRAPTDLDRPRDGVGLTLAALLGLTGLAYAAVSRQLKPLQAISAGVQRFGYGQFAQPIALRRNDELGDLARRINAMAQRLQGMLDAKRALLLAMSHELRSPLTRARVNAELLDDSPERSVLLRDMGEMRDLISSLLEGERLASGHSALQTENLDLVALAKGALVADTDANPSPSTSAATLLLSAGPVIRQADPTRLRLLLRNLLHNAQVHGAGGDIELFLRQETDGRWALGVRDHGPGVDAAQLAQLAQAFYRPDSSRNRASGGVGLGLYLCRLVAQAHGGELRLRRAEPSRGWRWRWCGSYRRQQRGPLWVMWRWLAASSEPKLFCSQSHIEVGRSTSQHTQRKRKKLGR